MAISGQETIRIGAPNESANSDSLFVAFTKAKNNFSTLFNAASSFNTFTGNTGISTSANTVTGTIDITNTGVTSIVAGTNITINQSNGAVTISSNAGGNGGGGTVTSVGLLSSTLSVASSPVVSSGNITVDLPVISNVSGTFSAPVMTVDQYGRISNISNGITGGTVSSVGVTTSGAGLQVSGGPITTSGNINIINTGVTRLNAGTGISLSSSNGNVTISTITLGGTVTSVGLASTSLNVTNSPITNTGTISVELPSNVAINGQLLLNSSQNLANGGAANLAVTASYFTTTGASTATLAAGTSGQIKTFMMAGDGGDMVITVTNAGWKSSGAGSITFNDIGDGCTLQYTNNKWYCIGQNGVTFG